MRAGTREKGGKGGSSRLRPRRRLDTERERERERGREGEGLLHRQERQGAGREIDLVFTRQELEGLVDRGLWPDRHQLALGHHVPNHLHQGRLRLDPRRPLALSIGGERGISHRGPGRSGGRWVGSGKETDKPKLSAARGSSLEL